MDSARVVAKRGNKRPRLTEVTLGGAWARAGKVART
jgi:hypothetical protein